MTKNDPLDDLVIRILAPYEYVAFSMLNASNDHPMPIRKPIYDKYMKVHNTAKQAIKDEILKARPAKDEHSHMTRNYCLDCAKRDGFNQALKDWSKALGIGETE